jgi:hypothetical protein
MTRYEEIAIEALEERLTQVAPIPVRRRTLADVIADGWNPHAVLMFCYHSCRDIRGAMKLLHAVRYLHDPELYERCKMLMCEHKHRRFKPVYVSMSPIKTLVSPVQDYHSGIRR